MVIRNWAGRMVGRIEQAPLGNGHVILDRRGERVGRLEKQQDGSTVGARSDGTGVMCRANSGARARTGGAHEMSLGLKTRGSL